MRNIDISKKKFVVFILVLLFLSACKKENQNQNNTNHNNTTYGTIENTYGFGLLKKIPGIWAGPLTSTTMLGSFPEWISDLRPISAAQVSGKNELNKNNDIFLSFFVAKHNNEYRLCFRNGGLFGGMSRISYFLCDSVNETTDMSYYRFSEIKKGIKRAYSEVIFVKDSMYLRSYTNKNNTEPEAVLHMSWSAKLQDTTSMQNAIQQFQYPKKELVKDFSHTFDGFAESIFYSTDQDPYKEQDQPYLGKAILTFSATSSLTMDPNKKVFLVVTTQPLINGFVYNPQNMKYRSRYVVLYSNENSFTFNYMHPGSYYLYAFYDYNGDNVINSGDWMSSNATTFTLSPKSTYSTSVIIDFPIP